MCNRELRLPSLLGRVAVYVFSLPFLIVAFTVLAFAQTPGDQPPAPPASVQPDQAPSAQVLKDWSAGMVHTPKPGQGCFSASYPNTEWQQVPCTTAPERPYPPARRGGSGPNVIGNGSDVSAEAAGGFTIAEVEGSFDSVTGVTSETGQVNGSGGQVANTFSLQLNTNFFTGTAACNGASVPANCQGWQQFVYSNAGSAFIQYWLISYNTTCPNGWNTATIGSNTDCWRNGANSVSVPAQTIANLANLELFGLANTTGSEDQVVMVVAGKAYSAFNPASMLNLYQFWSEAEFNIVGDCCSSQANFNAGSSLVVRTSVDTGTSSAPSCDGQGFTGETNNLNFASPPGAAKGAFASVVFTESSSGAAGSPCASATEHGSFYANLVDTHDFNNDGYSDILWRDVGGDAAIWLIHGGTIQGGVSLGNVATNWSIVGVRDFNGDGVPDLLWRDTAGDVWIWLMKNNGTVLQSSVIGNVPTAYSVAGTGDFNGDGKGDILWRDTSGDNLIWFMNGFAVTAVSLPNVPTIWSVAGISDFNNDGKSDILWHDVYGDVSIWEMSGATIVTGAGLGNIPTNWSIVGTGDFNGDFYGDILWRDTAGDVMIQLISNAALLQQSVLGNVPTTWSIAATGDFNGDDKSDILWLDTSGNVMIWYMNGFAVSAVNFGNVGTLWAVQGANAD